MFVVVDRGSSPNKVGIKIAEARKTIEYPELPANSKITIIAVECTGRFRKALSNGARTSQSKAERRRLPHLPTRTSPTSEAHTTPGHQKFHYNVAEAQLELHIQNISGASEPSQKHATDTSRRARGRRETIHDLGLRREMVTE